MLSVQLRAKIGRFGHREERKWDDIMGVTKVQSDRAAWSSQTMWAETGKLETPNSEMEDVNLNIFEQ